jgi:hypothetical protein
MPRHEIHAAEKPSQVMLETQLLGFAVHVEIVSNTPRRRNRKNGGQHFQPVWVTRKKNNFPRFPVGRNALTYIAPIMCWLIA